MLGKGKSETAIELLINALKDDHPAVRRTAALGLGKIGDKRACEPLMQALDDSEELVRRASQGALSRIIGE